MKLRCTVLPDPQANMTDKIDEKLLSARLDALCPGSRRRRGRPRNGFEKALRYADEVWALRLAGVRPWRSITEVAAKYRKNPLHIAACFKMINDTPTHEFWEVDET
jgi:hypothetical protein